MKKILTAISVAVVMMMMFDISVSANESPQITGVVQEELRANDSEDLVRLTITTNRVVDTVWVRHSTPQRFPRARLVRTSGNVRTWEIAFTPIEPGSQYVSVEANVGFRIGGAIQRVFITHPADEVEESAAFRVGQYIHKHVITLPIGYVFTGLISEGMLAVRNIEGLYGFASSEGRIVVSARYNIVRGFSEGLAAVAVRDGASNNNLWGFVDMEGNEVVSPQYVSVHPFQNGFARVRTGDARARTLRYGFVDRNGREVISPRFPIASDFSEGFAAVQMDTGRVHEWSGETIWQMGFINERGREVIPPRYAFVSDFHNGFALVADACCGWTWDRTGLPVCGARLNGMALIDTRGNEVRFIPNVCHATHLHGNIHRSNRSFSEGLIWTTNPQGNLWGIVDLMGNVLAPHRYTSAGNFYEGLARVLVGNRWGFIDKEGNEVIRPIYAEVQGFSEGLAAVRVGNYWGFIDTQGNEVIRPNQFNTVGSFVNGLTFAQISDIRHEVRGGREFYLEYGLAGFIDKAGNIVIPFEHTDVRFDGDIMMLGNGLSWSPLNTLGVWGFDGAVLFGGGDGVQRATGGWRTFRVAFEDYPQTNPPF